MQALTMAISPSGIEYLTQQIVAHQISTALSSLVPPSSTVPVPNFFITAGDAIYNYSNFNISLSSGSLSNFSAALQSVTQNANGQFTMVMVASNVTVNYSSWKETYDYDESSDGYNGPTYPGSGGPWPYSMGISTLTFTVPVTLAQQAGSYTLTIGQVAATSSGCSPNIPSGSVLATTSDACVQSGVDSATLQALDSIDFQTPLKNTLWNLVLTIPASGHLTPNIVFNFNEGDTPLTFPSDNMGMSLGVTGNVTWQGSAYSGGTPPSLGMPSIPTSNDVHFYAADYEFNELYWAFYKDGKLHTTITKDQLLDPDMLTTDYYAGTSLDPLYQAYPDDDMTVEVTPQSPPTVTFQTVYQLVYGDNGVLTTQEAQLSDSTYHALSTLQGSVYLTQDDYTKALQMALGSNGTSAIIAQIEQASVVSGPFSQLYQVTSAGLSSLQGQLSSGAYQLLSSALKPGQVFINKGWLLAAVEKAFKSLALTTQYAPAIEAAFAVQGSYPQVYWVTPGTNGPLSTLVDQLPADDYNALIRLENNVYLDQPSFVTALQHVIGSAASQYVATITQAALVHGAIATHTVQADFKVLDSSQPQPITVFTVGFSETDLQQNFNLFIGPNNTQTVQFDFQLIRSGTKATLISSNIQGIDDTDFGDIWNFTLQPVYVEEMQKMAHTGVPLPFMAGFQFLFDQATVAVQPGYVEVLSDVKFIGTPAFIEALARDPGTVDLSALLMQAGVPTHETPPTREPVRRAASDRTPCLRRNRTAAAKTKLVRSNTAFAGSTSHERVQEGI